MHRVVFLIMIKLILTEMVLIQMMPMPMLMLMLMMLIRLRTIQYVCKLLRERARVLEMR